MNGYVRLSVGLSHLLVITCHWQNWYPCEGKGQRSKVTEIKTNFAPIWTFTDVTPVWIHWWQQNYAHWLRWYRGDSLLLFNVIYQISRSREKTNRKFGSEFGRFRISTFTLKLPMATKWCMKLEVAQTRCSIVFQCHPLNVKVTCAEKPTIWLRFECFQTVRSSHWYSRMAKKWHA